MTNNKSIDLWDSLTPYQQNALLSIESVKGGHYFEFEVLEHLGLASLSESALPKLEYNLTDTGKQVLIAYRERRNAQWDG